MKCLAFGNNVCGNLDPALPSTVVSPTEIPYAEILWHGWTCTVARAERGVRVWGMGKFEISGSVKKVLGHDEPVGYLDADSRVTFSAATSQSSWDDVTVPGVGGYYACRGRDLYHFSSLDVDCQGTRLNHALLTDNLSLYSMESRVFVFSRHGAGHLFEAIPELRLVEDLEGLGIMHVVPGYKNRIAVLTTSGDAYIIDTRSARPKLVEKENVKLIGLGADFDIVVNDKIWGGRRPQTLQN
ncbi:hypothetical protein BCR39DRAFT_557073 [Naematelia encephala]|uniref:Regulator of chromosome condensation 1/beta-lactamase-inhibitor protein II n=1 Tax=Naematelia encephala TaxID=71784 RepID=A0A1Y2BH05_9TREE|nr:hypothetical protein BCR39DRAFT_557073 [Naematelia encephala]